MRSATARILFGSGHTAAAVFLHHDARGALALRRFSLVAHGECRPFKALEQAPDRCRNAIELDLIRATFEKSLHRRYSSPLVTRGVSFTPCPTPPAMRRLPVCLRAVDSTGAVSSRIVGNTCRAASGVTCAAGTFAAVRIRPAYSIRKMFARSTVPAAGPGFANEFLAWIQAFAGASNQPPATPTDCFKPARDFSRRNKKSFIASEPRSDKGRG